MIARATALVVLAVALAIFPLFAGTYPVKLLQEILIFGIFAMSLDLLMGYAGMVSFGHSAFFASAPAAALTLVVASPHHRAPRTRGGTLAPS
jgi:branched-chain amino acid transport system permease protein